MVGITCPCLYGARTKWPATGFQERCLERPPSSFDRVWFATQQACSPKTGEMLTTPHHCSAASGPTGPKGFRRRLQTLFLGSSWMTRPTPRLSYAVTAVLSKICAILACASTRKNKPGKMQSARWWAATLAPLFSTPTRSSSSASQMAVYPTVHPKDK